MYVSTPPLEEGGGGPVGPDQYFWRPSRLGNFPGSKIFPPHTAQGIVKKLFLESPRDLQKSALFQPGRPRTAPQDTQEARAYKGNTKQTWGVASSLP